LVSKIGQPNPTDDQPPGVVSLCRYRPKHRCPSHSSDQRTCASGVECGRDYTPLPFPRTDFSGFPYCVKTHRKLETFHLYNN
jgi:hypothetical protein